MAAGWNVVERNKGGRGNLLLIHGHGDDSSSWEPLYRDPSLSHYSTFAFDLPGCGHTPVDIVHGEYTLDSVIRAIEELIDSPELRQRSFTVVGHSLGGVIATLLAERNPSRFNAVVDVEGNLTSHDSFWSGRVVKYGLGALQVLRDAVKARSATDPEMARYASALAKADARAYFVMAQALVEWSTGSRAGRRYLALKQPHVYCGSDSDSFPQDSRLFLEGAGATVLTFPGTSHWVMNAGDFGSRLASWIDTNVHLGPAFNGLSHE